MTMTGVPGALLVTLLALSLRGGSLSAADDISGPTRNEASAEEYRFEVATGTLTMRDGVRLAVTYYMPLATCKGETFPAILEMLPYRKDDIFCLGDYEYGSYFAARGYVIARVDVRGTGGSGGRIPDREYSDAELMDAVEVIDKLSRKKWSNGNVGMYGISWSGFNSLMTAYLKPPALKAIIAACASTDLFYNDVHYIDGVMHLDYYAQQIDTDNFLPRSTRYQTNARWFHDRFEREPWIFTWFRNQQDNDFWRSRSLCFKEGIELPAYLIGGLLDGYRDFVPKVFESSKAPVIAEIGPWNHAWPEYGKPGPNYEWRERALRWWDHWLKGRDTGILDEPRFMVFVRDGHTPSTMMDETPGEWRWDKTWPLEGTTWTRLHPCPDHLLADAAPAGEASDALAYHAGAGMAAGGWWGDRTSDMAADDALSLVYDSAILGETVEIIGNPKVSLRVTADAPRYQWTVRLEDVWPDGKVSLVSGALINPSQRESRLDPKPLVPGEPAVLSTEIHFTTWRFKPGHRVRLAVSNAQFPMAWPSPFKGTTNLLLGADTWIGLPVPPPPSAEPMDLPEPEKSDEAPFGQTLYSNGPTSSASRDGTTGESVYTTSSETAWRIGGDYFDTGEYYEWRVEDDNPAEARFEGFRRHVYDIHGKGLNALSHMVVSSDESNFTIDFTKMLLKNGRLLKKKTWSESIPRNNQ